MQQFGKSGHPAAHASANTRRKLPESDKVYRVEILIRIKRLVMARKIIFTRKAGDEMEADGLTEDEVIESIVTARRIEKSLRSTSASRTAPSETLYVLRGMSFSNIVIYTKGKILRDADRETFYVLISSKRAI